MPQAFDRSPWSRIPLTAHSLGTVSVGRVTLPGLGKVRYPSFIFFVFAVPVAVSSGRWQKMSGGETLYPNFLALL